MMIILLLMLRDHLLSTYAKFSEQLIYFTPLTCKCKFLLHMYVIFFGKLGVTSKWMTPDDYFASIHVNASKSRLNTDVRFSTEVKSHMVLSSFHPSCEGTLNFTIDQNTMRRVLWGYIYEATFTFTFTFTFTYLRSKCASKNNR